MKRFAFLCLFAAGSALAAPSQVDLDADFLRATHTSVRWLEPAADFSRGWDGSGAFPSMVRQSPFGACQSFSMTAMMEYLFYRETGKTLKISEKQMAYSLLKLMIEANWSTEKNAYERKPDLGYGVAPLMIETVARAGLLPNADYPWGDFETADGSRSIDVVLFNRVFDKAERDYTPAEYAKFLDESFLSRPPASFRYVYKSLNFETGKDEEVTLRSPAELSQASGFDKNRFRVLHNAEFNPVYQPRNAEERRQVLGWLEGEAARFGVKAETVPGAAIVDAIVASLQRRMVVLVAADVWTGSWTDKLVYGGGGGHGMVIVGYQYRGGDLYLKIRNSWGKKAGVEGYNFVKAATLLPNVYYVMEYR